MKKTRWLTIKTLLMVDFKDWINECPKFRYDTPKDMFEFLYQKGYIRGKKWRKFIKDIDPTFSRFMMLDIKPLEEGKIPPDSLV